jgi:hypothetical protein
MKFNLSHHSKDEAVDVSWSNLTFGFDTLISWKGVIYIYTTMRALRLEREGVFYPLCLLAVVDERIWNHICSVMLTRGRACVLETLQSETGDP